MDIGIISNRYAKALLAYAELENRQLVVFEQARLVLKRYQELPDLKRAVDNPVLDKAYKYEILCEAAGGVESVERALRRFFRLVLEQHREDFLPFMLMRYTALFNERRGVHIGVLTTATEVPELKKLMEKLASNVIQERVYFDTKIDPSIIGGYIAQLDGYRLDASVATQIQSIKRQFLAKNRRIV